MALTSELRYFSAADFTHRLSNCIIKYKEKPVYVLGNEGLAIDMQDSLTGVVYRGIHSSDTDIDVRSVPLGYWNSNNGAKFVCRQPSRRAIQGVHPSNIIWITRYNGQFNSLPIRNGEVMSKTFFEMLNELYPTLEQCFKDLKGQVTSVAFKRKLAVSVDDIGLNKLEMMGSPIAVWNDTNSVFKLTDKYAHYLPVLKSFEIPIELA